MISRQWPLCCLLILLFCYQLVQPSLLFADTPLVTQEIRYHLAEAGEVFLVWGINNWTILPEEVRPSGTFIENNVMHTPMKLEGDTFVAKVQVPAGVTFDYGFQIRTIRNGLTINWVWDGDYHAAPTEDGVIEVASNLKLIVTQEIRYHTREASEVFLLWGLNGWQVVPETMRPEGTIVKDRVMRTPLVREGNHFMTQLQVPAGATIDYGFRISQTPSGATVDVWDADGEQDYHTVATIGKVIEVQATPHLVRRAAIGTFDYRLQWGSFLALFIGMSLVLGLGALQRKRTSPRVNN